jgi:hypothetical protein
MAFRDAKNDVQWLAYVPEGYVSVSAGAKASINWNLSSNLTQTRAWDLLQDPRRIAQALHSPPDRGKP